MDSNYPVAEESTTSPEPRKADKMDREDTFLVPKSAFKGKDIGPGHECKIRVEKSYQDEYECSYVKDDGASEGEGTMESAQNRLSSMAV